MAIETVGFWTIALPAITALLGSAIGIAGTYFVTKSSNQHDKEMRKQEFSETQKVQWERSEARRKEERHFELKKKAYEGLVNTFGDMLKEPNEIRNKQLVNRNRLILLYGSLLVKDLAEKFTVQLKSYEKCHEKDKMVSFDNVDSAYKELRIAMRKDLEIHFKHID